MALIYFDVAVSPVANLKESVGKLEWTLELITLGVLEIKQKFV